MTADEIIRLLALQPHPEGGFFRETFRDTAGAQGRPHATAIYYLLRAGEASRWHRIDAVEIWHWYLGAPLELVIADGGVERMVLGSKLDSGERPQVVVPANCWQRAATLGAFTLVGCTVAPGFEFSKFELAPEGWQPK
jgi:predicted cupin superfamily sugar epimerase